MFEVIYAIKTIIGRENIVIEAMAGKVKAKGLNVKAMVHPEEIKGYVFVEGELRDIEGMIREIPHARGILRKTVSITSIKRFLESKKVEIKINTPIPENRKEELEIVTGKLAQGLISTERAMKQIGIKNPPEELAKILAENAETNKLVADVFNERNNE